MTPRQLVGLRIRQRAVDLGHKFIDDRALNERGLQRVTAGAVVFAFIFTRSKAAAAACRVSRLARTFATVAFGGRAGRMNAGYVPAASDIYPSRDVRIDPWRHHDSNTRCVDARKA